MTTTMPKPMQSRERRFDVLLNGNRAGILHAVGDYTWFILDPEYAADPQRAVLGLRFEQNRHARHRANMRLPPWFSNLLPEGPLREWIAAQRGVAVERELELLAEVGHDLPGAVTVVPMDRDSPVATGCEVVARRPSSVAEPWRFSLAGVQLKFSMLKSGERFTAPAVGEEGDWIVKLPDAKFPHVPQNEFAMMELARRVGLNVPETRLISREVVESVPDRLWPTGEVHAFAVRRFDRGPNHGRIHIEDLAQVRDFYPDDKYRGTFETVGSLIYRRHDIASVVEFARRLAFNILIRNADAHLKNWSLIYENPRIPTLSPVYDLVATSVYPTVDRELALKLDGSRRFETVTFASFERLQRVLGVPPDAAFRDEAERVVDRALAAWPEIRSSLEDESLGAAITAVLDTSAGSLRGSQ